ncbi:MAG: hypothetical protein ACFFC1_14855, partial [Promethearchaeota archaeon]
MNYKCAICGNNKGKHKVDFSKRLNIDMTKFQVVKCLRCGFHSLEPGPTNDELKIIYKNYSEQGNRLEVEKWRLINIYPHKI